MYYDVVSAKYIDQYKILVSFRDGTKGIVNLKKYTKKGGVFQAFSDINFFKRFKVHPELMVLTWGNSIDIAPETLYKAASHSEK